MWTYTEPGIFRRKQHSVRPADIGGVAIVGMRRCRIRRELLDELAARGTYVTHVDGLGALCARLLIAPADVVVWDRDLANIIELDRVWSQFGQGKPPRFVLVRRSGGLFLGHVQTCRPDCDALLAAVKRAVRHRRR